MSSHKTPNFFLIGAPKCGTTSLAHYLSEHPQVFLSTPKELYFWDKDHVNGSFKERPTSLEGYLKFFSGADHSKHAVIGEGSTTYAQSRVAVPEIVRFSPQARFIMMLRNPVDLVHSLHEHLVRRCFEEEENPETAWELQSKRKQGEQLPANNQIPDQLQYRDVATFAPQIRRLFESVPASQRMVILFDDFTKDIKHSYHETLQFLSLADDGRTSFPSMNAARVSRFKFLRKLYQAPPAILDRPIAAVRNWYVNNRGLLRSTVRRLAVRDAPKKPLRPEFREYLSQQFREDIRETSELLGRDLSHWVHRSPVVK